MSTKKSFASKFRFLEKAVTADVAFEAFGKSLNEVFANAALATSETMVDTDTVSPRMQKAIKLQNKDINALLIDFLNEVIYYKDAEQIFLSKFDVDIKQTQAKQVSLGPAEQGSAREKEKGVWILTAKIAGEPLDYKRHLLRADAKAATWHMFELQKKGKQWTARVVLDI